MIRTIFCVVIYLIYQNAVAADEISPPPHYQSECVACHEQMVSGDVRIFYTRRDRRVQNYEQLQRRVDYCIEQLNLDWNAQQRHTVVDYLATRYYQYSPP